MQLVEFLQTAPVTAIEGVTVLEIEGHGHRPTAWRTSTTRIASGSRSASRLKKARVR